MPAVLPMQGAWVPSLVRELRSHMPCSVAEKKKEKKRREREYYWHYKIDVF